MVEYVVVALQHPSGGWVAAVPDFVGVTGRATTMEHAIDRATAAAREVCATIVAIKKAMPEPLSLAAIQKDARWAREYGIDWERAVIKMVPLAHRGRVARRAPVKRESKVAEWSRRVAARRAAQLAASLAAE